jgi:hypothetical protein
MPTVRISIEETGALEALKQYLNENIEVITSALSFEKVERNERATVDEISVLDVRIVESGAVELDYEYEWSFFSGCKDISDEGVVQATVKGQLVGGCLEFEEVARPEPRSTLDEF